MSGSKLELRKVEDEQAWVDRRHSKVVGTVIANEDFKRDDNESKSHQIDEMLEGILLCIYYY